MKPLFYFLTVSSLVITANAQLNPNYVKANNEYRDAIFGYLNGKLQAKLNLVAYQDAVSDVPRKQQTLASTKNTASQIQNLKNSKENQIKSEQSNLTQMKNQLEDAVEKGLQDLDQNNGSDVVQQLEQRKVKLTQEIATVQVDIDVVQRNIDRVKRSADYVFYVKEIEIRKQKHERLTREEQSLNTEISNIVSEVTRLQDLLSTHRGNKTAAEQSIPGLKADLDKANRDLTAAQQSGDSFAIQIAESRFRQAHLNLRRVEVQLDEATVGIVEVSGQIDKKNKLLADKRALVAVITADKNQAILEWKELHTAFLDYHKQNLADYETRLNELTQRQSQVRSRLETTNRLVALITGMRDQVTAQVAKLETLNTELESLGQQLSSAQTAVVQADAALNSATQLVAQSKEVYNSSVSQNRLDYESTLKKQKANEDAAKSTTASIVLGGLQ